MVDKSTKKNKVKIKSWYSNRYQIVVVQRNILLLFTLISMLSVAVSVFFVKNIMSSKSLEPYVIEVEEKTGVATVVNQMSSENLTADVAIRKYFINKFVHAASGYDPKTYKMDVEIVRTSSTPQVYSDFRNRINVKELSSNVTIDVRIKSIQFPENNTAQVRILKQIETEGQETKTTNEIITLGFYFSPEMQLTMEERLINPLGFQVNKYIAAEEVFNY